MIYENIKLGIHETTILQFGDGDIMVSVAEDPEGVYQTLLFSLDEPGPIGENRERYNLTGKQSDDLPNIKLSMRFNKTESIDVIIEKLTEAKTNLQKKEIN
jgi:hypothetical protein